METPAQNQKKDPLEESLTLLEKENREFENHWVWKRLGCKPDKFFQAFEKHVASIDIPKDRWETALKRAKDASRVLSKEKQSHFNPINLEMMQSLQV